MNEKIIWDYLLPKVKNPFGVAAIMGNLMAESSLNPANATGKNKTASYVDDADSGRIDFVHDGIAFGLAQWCYWSRKQGLLDFAKSKGKSVGDIYMQLDYMWDELQKYKTALTAVLEAKDVRSASDVFMLKYEKPAGTGEAAKQKRASYGQKYYDTYAVTQTATKDETPAEQPVSGKQIVITANAVNVRAGNGKSFPALARVNTGDTMPWIATSENGWHAFKKGAAVCWVSGDFSKVVG